MAKKRRRSPLLLGKVARRPRARLGNYDEDEGGEVEEGPSPEDYTITPCGRLGSKICVSQVEGKFLGEFLENEDADKAICARMEKEQFYPGVWFIDDHGGVQPYSLDCEKPKRRKKR